MLKDNWSVESKKKNGFTKILFFIAYIVICGAIGFFIGYFSDNFVNLDSKNDNMSLYLLKLFILFLMFFIGYLFHIIVHETGHLIFGLLTGYSFVSFRIGPFIVVKEEDKLKFKKFNLPGTAGQCLMEPPEIKEGKYPFVIYNYGGVILNLIVSIISILIGLNANYPFNTLLITSSMAGIIVVLTNGIPLKIGGMPNDAYNVLSIIRDEEAKRGFYIQLKVHAMQTKSIRIKDMSIDTFKLKEDADLSNPLNTALKLIEYNWYLDNLDLDNAKKCIESFKPYFKKIATIFKHEINCERMFLELVGNCDRNLIHILYDKSLKKYVKAAKFMISKKRLLIAYEAFYNNNKEKALEYYKELKDLANKYPIKGEADMELMLANWIIEKL